MAAETDRAMTSLSYASTPSTVNVPRGQLKGDVLVNDLTKIYYVQGLAGLLRFPAFQWDFSADSPWKLIVSVPIGLSGVPRGKAL